MAVMCAAKMPACRDNPSNVGVCWSRGVLHSRAGWLRGFSQVNRQRYTEARPLEKPSRPEPPKLEPRQHTEPCKSLLAVRQVGGSTEINV